MIQRNDYIGILNHVASDMATTCHDASRQDRGDNFLILSLHFVSSIIGLSRLMEAWPRVSLN